MVYKIHNFRGERKRKVKMNIFLEKILRKTATSQEKQQRLFNKDLDEAFYIFKVSLLQAADKGKTSYGLLYDIELRDFLDRHHISLNTFIEKRVVPFVNDCGFNHNSSYEEICWSKLLNDYKFNKEIEKS